MRAQYADRLEIRDWLHKQDTEYLEVLHWEMSEELRRRLL